MVENEHVTIHWFKKGLRLHDNPALLHAVSTSKVCFESFFISLIKFKSDVHQLSSSKSSSAFFQDTCFSNILKRFV